MPFDFICEGLDALEGMKGANSRKQMLSVIANIFLSIILHKPNELIGALYFLLVKLSPDYVNLETGIGGENLVKAVGKLVTLEPKLVKKAINTMGDLGIVCAKKQVEKQKNKSYFVKSTDDGDTPPPLTLKQVFRHFYEIAATKGTACMAEKEAIVLRLLEQAKGGRMSKYIVRYLGGGLKIKVQEKLVLSALARAFALQ